MKNKIFQILLFSFFALPLFYSCKKENIDTSEITPEEVTPDTLICNLSIEIVNSSDIDSAFLSVNTIGATGALNYLWSEGSTSVEIFPEEDGIYYVTVTDELGCSAESQYDYTATIDPCALFSVQIVAVDSISPAFLFTNIVAGTEPFAYLWSEGSTSSTINVIPPGTFSVTITDSEGCTAEDEITL